MSMRSQVYEWSNLAASGQTSSLRRTVDAVPVVIPTNREYDIFIGGIGNNITKPAETTATQFIVIEDIACSAYLGGALQVRVNTTDYFQNPDVTDQAGVPGLASPYPRGSSDSAVTDSITDYVQLLKSFDLYPDVYVLPGQVFQILYSLQSTNGAAAVTTVVAAFVKYTLYDGPDALIANKLLELGVTINPNNVDWYKRTLIEQQQRSRVAAVATNGGSA